MTVTPSASAPAVPARAHGAVSGGAGGDRLHHAAQGEGGGGGEPEEELRGALALIAHELRCCHGHAWRTAGEHRGQEGVGRRPGTVLGVLLGANVSTSGGPARSQVDAAAWEACAKAFPNEAFALLLEVVVSEVHHQQCWTRFREARHRPRVLQVVRGQVQSRQLAQAVQACDVLQVVVPKVQDSVPQGRSGARGRGADGDGGSGAHRRDGRFDSGRTCFRSLSDRSRNSMEGSGARRRLRRLLEARLSHLRGKEMVCVCVW